MGFDEFGPSSMRNNRSLLRGALQKYFRGEKGVAANEKEDLGIQKRKSADAKRKHTILGVYLVLLIATAVMMVVIFVLLRAA